MTEKWSTRDNPRSTITSRWDGNIHLFVKRVPGALKRGDPLAWEWIASAGNKHTGPACALMQGRCADEASAQRAADAAAGRVRRAYAALTGGRA